VKELYLYFFFGWLDVGLVVRCVCVCMCVCVCGGCGGVICVMMDVVTFVLIRWLPRQTKLKVDFIRICGSTPGSARQGLVDKFQTSPDCRVANLSITAAGQGITLTVA